MREIFAAACAALLLALLFGCASSPAAPAGEVAPQHNYSIPFPASPADYTATYAVIDNGAQTEKRVVASGNSMKISAGGVSVYFLSDRAYSCSTAVKEPECFDVTARAAGMKMDEVYPCQHLGDASEAETVDIGGTIGQCYLTAYGISGSRKLCCTDRGVLAYDAYNATRSSTHVEYLTQISYEADYREFLLPAEAKAAPE